MERIKASDKKHHIFYIVLTAVALAAMLARCFFSVITTDEVFNIGEAYRTVLGQKFMVENWDFFQVGDSLNYPFIWLFYKITGSSEGIVIYSRICSVFITFVFSVFSFMLLRSVFGQKQAFATCLVYYSMVPYTLSSYWYDTWSLSFMLLSYIIILYGINKENFFPWLIMSGACQAIAVYSYPTIVAVFIYEFIILFIIENKAKKILSLKKPEIAYVTGAAIVFLVFIIFCITRNWQDFFIFNKQITSSNLSNRSYSFNSFIDSCKLLVAKALRYFKLEIFLSVVFSLVCFFIKKFNLTKVLIPIYLIVSTILIFTFYHTYSSTPGVVSQGQNYILFYFSLCAIPLHLFFFKKKKAFKSLFIFVYIPSIISGIMYSFTGMNGAIKFTFGFRPASLVFLLEFFDVILQTKGEKKASFKVSYKFILSLLLVINFLLLSFGSFLSDSPIAMFSSKKEIISASSGIYKHVYDYQEKIAELESFEKNLKSIVKNDDQTILCGDGLIYGYLMTNLKPNTNYLWRAGSLTGESYSSDYYNLLFKYFDLYYGFPDVIVIRPNGRENSNKVFMNFLDDNYIEKYSFPEYIIYHLK